MVVVTGLAGGLFRALELVVDKVLEVVDGLVLVEDVKRGATGLVTGLLGGTVVLLRSVLLSSPFVAERDCERFSILRATCEYPKS